MTQNEHTWLAFVISIVLHQALFHMVLKHHPVTKKNIMEWLQIFEEYFKK